MTTMIATLPSGSFLEEPGGLQPSAICKTCCFLHPHCVCWREGVHAMCQCLVHETKIFFYCCPYLKTLEKELISLLWMTFIEPIYNFQFGSLRTPTHRKGAASGSSRKCDLGRMENRTFRIDSHNKASVRLCTVRIDENDTVWGILGIFLC